MNSLTRKLAAGVIAAATMLGIAGLGATTANAANASDGVIKVSSSSAEFAGKEVKIYQMFSYDADAVNAGTATNGGYTLIDGWKGFFQNSTELGLTDVTDANVAQKAYDYVAGLSDTSKPLTTAQFAKKASDWAKTAANNMAATGTQNAADAAVNGKYTVTFANLAYGYYLVSPAAGSTDAAGTNGEHRGTDAILVNVLNGTAVEQDLKSTYPTVEKTVGGDTHNSAQIGDSIDFKLASTVPDMTEYTKGYTFKFTDTLSKGLTLNGVTAETDGTNTFAPTVKIDGVDNALVKGTDYTATVVKNQDGTTSLTVEMLNFKNKQQYAGKAITVEYSATLNENAVVGGTGNDNTAKVEYSNDPNGTGTGTSQEDKTYTYDFNFDIEKVNAADKTEKLQGAQFELQDKNGTKIDLVKAVDGTSFRPAKAGETAVADTDVVTGTDGKLQFTGLKEGTYKLKETKAPEGYNLLTSEITVAITAEYDVEGKLTSWSVNNATSNGTDAPVIQVENNKGLILPGTGGMGTALFTVLGVLIVALGAGWYVKSNRKSSEHAA